MSTRTPRPRPEVGNWIEITRGPDKGTRGQITRIDTGDRHPVYLVRPAGQKTARPYPLRALTVRAAQLASDLGGEVA